MPYFGNFSPLLLLLFPFWRYTYNKKITRLHKNRITQMQVYTIQCLETETSKTCAECSNKSFKAFLDLNLCNFNCLPGKKVFTKQGEKVGISQCVSL